ncbi:hypothetical protein [Tomitella biformata]|uniref:hypothetical protein n=1 Tax=Tomitella biformata TaxID=630403 RepID=UPI00130E575A|nr:hypothetical protein [Tomitella biformata]
MRMLFRAMFRLPADRRAVASIVDGYSWTTYGYKFGRWRWSGSLWTTFFSSGDGWKQTFNSFQLIDLKTGQALGEMVARNRSPLGLHRMSKFAGTVEFAGDPALFGAYRIVGDRRTVFTHTPWGPFRKAVKAARDTRVAGAQFTDAVVARRAGFSARHGVVVDREDRQLDRELINGERIGRPWIADYPY